MSKHFVRISILILVAICAVDMIAGLPPPFANGDCDHPPDFATGENCFAAQFPCPYFYLGIGGAPDYAKALNLCKANNSGAFVAMMYLNGEGTPRDLNKAEAALKVWKQNNPDHFDSTQADTLEKAIKRCRRATPQACPRVDYCRDLAEATLDMEICDAAAQVSAEAALSRYVERIRNTLSANGRAEFDRVVVNFKAYEFQEDARSYDEFADGTLRGLAATGQAEFVRENFLKLMHQTIEARNLQPVTTRAYEAVSRELERELSRNLRRILLPRQEDLKDPERKDLWEQARTYIEDYRKAASDSQLQWVKFRDSAAELAASLYRDQAGKFDPAVSMKAFMTKLRIAELRHNPIGPEQD